MLQTEFGRLEQRIRREMAQQSLLQVIRARFPEAPGNVDERVNRVRNQAVLTQLIDRAAVARDWSEFEPLLGS